MAINGISFGNTILGSSIQSLKVQMADLQNQLTSGKKSTTYSGMGANEGFAIAARAQLSNIAAYTDTMTKINTNIQVANTALQALSDIGTQLQTAANSGSQALSSAGQTAGQQTAVSEFSSMVGILNTQAGDRYIFSGSTIYTQPVASSDLILNGNGVGQAGLKQVISERNQADLGASGLGRLNISSPTTTSVSVAEDASPSVYGLKLGNVTSTLTGATVTNTPATVNLATNPADGDTVNFTFLQADGTSKTVQLTATTTVPAPAGSFEIGATAAATATNLNATLTAAEATASPYGAQLTGVSSNVAGVTVTPAQASIDLGATNPAAGDTVSFTFNLPDGSSETVQLTASSEVPTPAGSFAIGATPAATAANLNTQLTKSIGTLAKTSLVAASAIRATHDFFDSPPQRVDVTPPATLATATGAVNGTAANTVQWYTGDAGTGSARATSSVRVDSSVTVQYGIRANEDAIRSLMESAAVLAAVTTSPTDPNGANQISALNARIAQNLTVTPGKQSIQDIQADLANAQTVMKDATARQTLTQATMQNIVDQAENVSTDQVASQLLALQTDLQASYQTTSMLSQLSLVKFLPIG
ncbi:flagellar biosynthesis protein FlgL [Nitrobacter sp. NHB1]|uniref:flagellar biosynthesis protein FlgL n=1 Tax=Nitrobacter sp. NHB1 TaxID=3119830 RepID=UPI00300096A7